MKHLIVPAKSHTHYTPQAIINGLGFFDLDPCTNDSRPFDTAKKHYTPKDNGLLMPWEGMVWCNPPYGSEYPKWLRRCWEHQNSIALVFARTETKAFHRNVWERANGIFFFEGRLRFLNTEGLMPTSNAPAPSVLIAYGKEANERVANFKAMPGFYLPILHA